MGFGHRVYRTEDPRAKHLKSGVKDLSEKFNETQWLQILDAVENEMAPYKRLGVAANVDFYAGVVYYLLNIPHEFFVPIFAIGRIPGWIISIIEQYEKNILIRPLLEYNGPNQREYVPIEKR
jgi:citrate synthase